MSESWFESNPCMVESKNRQTTAVIVVLDKEKFLEKCVSGNCPLAVFEVKNLI